MSTAQNTPAKEGNSPVTWATVNYVSKDGTHVTLGELEDTLDRIACIFEDCAKVVRGKGREALQASAELIRNRLIPDHDAMQPEPDPIAEAQALLLEERYRAQELLRAEAARIKKEAVIKEAFFMPAEILNGIMDITTPTEEAGSEQYREIRNRINAFLEEQGWKTDSGFGEASPKFIRSREPLRQLANLIERHPAHHLRGHLQTILHHALCWCENTSRNLISPISGKADGIAPDGVLYPHISMELVKVERSRDVPKEWMEPLVPEKAKE